MAGQITLNVAGDLSEIGRVAKQLEDFARSRNLPAEAIEKVNLCLDELLTNIISYGFRAGAQPRIALCVDLSNEVLSVDMVDNGSPFDPFSQASPPDLESEVEDRPVGGLGIHLVKSLADHFEYRRDDDRNRITLRFFLDSRLGD